MNREILFRGKKTINGEWVEGDLFQHSEQRFIMGNNRNTEVMPSTVGQYTGLKDKNGVKIFEGDILEAMNGNRGYVVFEHGAFMKSCIPKGVMSSLTIATDVNAVIGNIHDNPELLKGEENENELDSMQ